MPALFLGGAETQFRMLFEKARAKGFDFTILSLQGTQNSEAYNQFITKYAGHIKERNCKNRWLLIKLLYLAYHILYFRIKGLRNILVYETYWLLLLPLMKLLSYKVLYSERNSGYHKCPFMYYLISKCDFVGTNSVEAKNVLSQQTKRNDILVINNGVVLPATNIYKKNFNKNPFRIIVPARICKVKNQQYVIESLYDIENIEVHFAGKISEKDYYAFILKQITDLKVKSKFIFDGFCENWLESYKDFDLVLLPSLEEGTPNVILESFANKRPILVSDIDMNVRLEKNPDFIFSLSDKNSLKEKIIRIMSITQNEIDRHLQTNYEFVKQNYSVDAMIMSYIKELK